MLNPDIPARYSESALAETTRMSRWRGFRKAKLKGINAAGPFPADTFFAFHSSICHSRESGNLGFPPWLLDSRFRGNDKFMIFKKPF